MKNQDLFTKRLFSITICSCAILLCSGFFLFSVNTVSAKHNELVPMPQTSVVGKYMMQSINYELPDGTVKQVLVWDTETGKSKRYYWETGGANKGWKPTEMQLPDKPL
jgi:hypothetical protein